MRPTWSSRWRDRSAHRVAPGEPAMLPRVVFKRSLGSARGCHTVTLAAAMLAPQHCRWEQFESPRVGVNRLGPCGNAARRGGLILTWRPAGNSSTSLGVLTIRRTPCGAYRCWFSCWPWPAATAGHTATMAPILITAMATTLTWEMAIQATSAGGVACGMAGDRQVRLRDRLRP
jgi:hypothetical protein